jgi:formylglycine-generating enzyme required for sulfatase activity
MPLSTGQILNNRYRIVKLLGQGGFGAVYRAWDINLSAPCAVKENFDVSPEASRQFAREASLLANLRHPGLPKVIDHFSLTNQGQYLVMEFIEGDDLQKIVFNAGGGLPEAQALPWILQVCQALEYLHTRNPPVIHRDVKPANIKITPEGQAVLVDFGIAKQADPAIPTYSGARASTPGYSPIEQYKQSGTDARSDIYSLGATLYFSLTGECPPESIDRLTGTALVPPRQLNPAISPPVEAAVLKAMQVLPDQRIQAVAELSAALRAAQSPEQVVAKTTPTPTSGPYSAPPATPSAPQAIQPPTGSRRLSWGWIFGLLVLIAAVLGSIAWLATFLSSRAVRQSIDQTATASAAAQTALPPTDASLGEPWTRPADGMRMEFIPAGSFLMGSLDGDTTADSDEKPQHSVYLNAYWIDQTEVTNAQMARCVAAGICQPPSLVKSYTRSTYYGEAQFDNYPVIYVTWEDANSYCTWAGGRLPTEAEWEKAARGPVGQTYPWGNEPVASRLVNFCDWNCPFEWKDSSIDDGYADTSPVGNFPAGASPYGVLDMAGNVWEWVQDWYSETYYASSPSSNPIGPSSGQYRVLRGGAFSDIAAQVRSSFRNEKPDHSNWPVGFRCAATPGK